MGSAGGVQAPPANAGEPTGYRPPAVVLAESSQGWGCGAGGGGAEREIPPSRAFWAPGCEGTP